MTRDDAYLVKLKGAGIKDHIIAAKFGIPVAEVQKRWERITQEVASRVCNGEAALYDAFGILCNQYQLVGESLKIVAGAVSNKMPDDELVKLISEDPRITLNNLKNFAIVLRPFVPPQPEVPPPPTKN